MRRHFEFTSATLRGCYNEPYYTMKAPDGKTANFLDYLGTHMLDQDIDRLRKALGIEKLSINGVSYGTVVGSTYASTYPEHIDKLLINGNMIPGPGTDEFYDKSAKAMTQTYFKLNQICDDQVVGAAPLSMELPHIGLAKFESVCSDNPTGLSVATEKKFDAMYADVSAGKYTASLYDGKQFALNPSMIGALINDGTRSEHSETAWLKTITELSALMSTNATIRKYATIGLLDRNCGASPPHADGPTALPDTSNGGLKSLPADVLTSVGLLSWYWYGTCAFHAVTPLSTEAMNAVDFTNRFTVAVAMQLYKTTKDKYGPAAMYMANLQTPFLFWPAHSTPVTFGWRQDIKALVVGNLYDGATPFDGTMWMRRGLPGASMVTWQGIGHAIVDKGADYDPDGIKVCLAMMDEYMLTGAQPLDGSTCRNEKKIMRADVAKAAAAAAVKK